MYSLMFFFILHFLLFCVHIFFIFFLFLYLLLFCFHISSRSSVLSRFRILSSSTFFYILYFLSAGMSFNHLLLLSFSLPILLSAFISSYIYFLSFLCLVFSKINSFPLLIERIFNILPYSPFSLLLFFSLHWLIYQPAFLCLIPPSTFSPFSPFSSPSLIYHFSFSSFISLSILALIHLFLPLSYLHSLNFHSPFHLPFVLHTLHSLTPSKHSIHPVIGDRTRLRPRCRTWMYNVGREWKALPRKR